MDKQRFKLLVCMSVTFILKLDLMKAFDELYDNWAREFEFGSGLYGANNVEKSKQVSHAEEDSIGTIQKIAIKMPGVSPQKVCFHISKLRESVLHKA